MRKVNTVLSSAKFSPVICDRKPYHYPEPEYIEQEKPENSGMEETFDYEPVDDEPSENSNADLRPLIDFK